MRATRRREQLVGKMALLLHPPPLPSSTRGLPREQLLCPEAGCFVPHKASEGMECQPPAPALSQASPERVSLVVTVVASPALCQHWLRVHELWEPRKVCVSPSRPARGCALAEATGLGGGGVGTAPSRAGSSHVLFAPGLHRGSFRT